jgi:hypothetical protein
LFIGDRRFFDSEGDQSQDSSQANVVDARCLQHGISPLRHRR